MALHPDRYPNRWAAGRYATNKPTFAPFPKEAVQEGRMTFDSPKGRSVLLGDAVALKWSKPLKVHWVFRDAPLALSVDAPEREALQLMADAVGAELKEDPKGYHIDFDLNEWRSRSMAQARSYMKDERISASGRARMAFALTALPLVLDKDVLYVADKQNPIYCRLKLSPALGQAAETFLSATAASRNGGMVSLIKPGEPPAVTIMLPATFGVAFPTKDGGSISL